MLNLNSRYQRPVIQLSSWHNFEALLDTGAFFPVWTANASSIPYGYIRDAGRNTYAVDAEMESIVRMIFEKRLAGVSGFAISGELNSRGIPSPF